MDFKVSDMLVFKDNNGEIYRDCVNKVDKRYSKREYKEGEEIPFHSFVYCGVFSFTYYSDGMIYGIESNEYYDARSYDLIEIWTMVDENTYKKVWEIGDAK